MRVEAVKRNDVLRRDGGDLIVAAQRAFDAKRQFRHPEIVDAGVDREFVGSRTGSCSPAAGNPLKAVDRFSAPGARFNCRRENMKDVVAGRRWRRTRPQAPDLLPQKSHKPAT